MWGTSGPIQYIHGMCNCLGPEGSWGTACFEICSNLREDGFYRPLSYAIHRVNLWRTFRLMNGNLGKFISELTRSKLTGPICMKRAHTLHIAAWPIS